MSKVIEQENASNLHIDSFKDASVFIKQDEDCISISSGKAREVSLAIYDWEKEKIDFAVGFENWREMNGWVKKNFTHPNKIGQYWSDVHCVYQSLTELIELYQQTLLTNGK